MNKIFFGSLAILLCIHHLSYPQLPDKIVQSIRENVFELVVEKSGIDTIIYEEPFPYDLLPYQERNDNYISLGTAFSIGEGRFASAAHVFVLHKKAFHGNYFIRAQDQRVFPVKDILHFSANRDYAIFTAEGIQSEGLRIADKYSFNSRVYACGNALGQGIIIRDGLLTSATKEHKNAEWEWLRFSAAASPGNSGGPLLNEDGEVIGLITMKSENENLNYALPSAEWNLNNRPSIRLNLDYTYTLPNLRKKSYTEFSEIIPGPIHIDRLHDYYASTLLNLYRKSIDDLYYSRKDAVFPDAASSPIHEPFNISFPTASYEKSENIWSFARPENISRMKTESGGTLQWGSMFNFTHFYYRKTRDESLETIFAKPGGMMERVLEGARHVRNAGKKEIRIKSFGTASGTQWHKDRWGRNWLIAEWDVPAINYVQLGFFLPLPDGFAGFIKGVPFSDAPVYTMDGKMLCDFIFMGYSGTGDDWKLFLGNEYFKPEVFQGLTLDVRKADEILIESPKFSFRADKDIPGFGQSSIITINTWWYPQNGIPGKDIYSLSLTHEKDNPAYTFFQKWPKPGKQASDDASRKWDTLKKGLSPYNRSPNSSNGNIYFSDIIGIDPGADPEFIYIMNTCVPESIQVSGARSQFISAVYRLRIKYQEQAAGKMKIEQDALTVIDGFTIFKAISANKLAVFERFLENGQDIESLNEAKDTPLLFSIKTNNIEFARRLLSFPANLNCRDSEGNTPLVLALRQKQLDLARLLIQKGADVNMQGPSGFGPLVLAMDKSYGDIPEMILGLHADPLSKSNALAVHMALREHRTDLAIKLAECNFPIDEKDSGGRTSLMYAIDNDDEDTAIFLIGKGASVDTAMNGGFTPLYESLRRKLPALSSFLIRRDCAINYSINGWTPLLLAAYNSMDDQVTSLIRKGADISAATEQGNTVLHFAVQYCSEETVQFILGSGGKALLEIKNNAGKTAMDISSGK